MTRRYAGRFIVKIQRPLVSTIDAVLVYNRSRSVHALLPMPHKVRRQIMGTDFKQFCYAHMQGSVLHIDGIAPWQEDW